MSAKTVSQLGFVFLLSAIAVLLFSVYRSSHGIPSRGLSILGTALLFIGIALRVRARTAGKS